jgi:poly(hydroxyalkanoate) depolymerase family esterase
MNNFLRSQPPPFNVKSITDTIERALTSAGLDTSSGPMQSVTETIRRALSSGGVSAFSHPPSGDGSVIDVAARVVGEPDEKDHEPIRRSPPSAPGLPGEFVTREFSNSAGTRAYKLYVPAKMSEAPLPLVVMLHGCTQSAEDFAAGTQMNRFAEEHGFLVVYPEQVASANMSKCWNWFQTEDQVRDSGEPSLIAGIVNEIAQAHRVDRRRIFVAGLSAGAAMAVILGEAYPEMFAGVGAHSGLPFASASDIPSAMAAMKGGRSGIAGLTNLTNAGPGVRRKTTQATPTIVFHGDRDHTVQQSNGAAIVQQASEAYAAATGDKSVLESTTRRGTASGGRSFSRTVMTDPTGQPYLESWTLHGAGHAWSGGSAAGSYTDGKGPDASAEMVRFFLAQRRAGTA